MDPYETQPHDARMHDEPSVELDLPARAESVTVVRQALSGLGEADGWSLAFLTDAKIAVSEACSNVVIHAYPDGQEGTLAVRMTIDGRRLIVVVRDSGVGMAPRIQDRSAGLGLGLPLIAALTTEVQLRSTADGYTEVTMVLTVPDDET